MLKRFDRHSIRRRFYPDRRGSASRPAALASARPSLYPAPMSNRRSIQRILINVGLDMLAALLAVPLAAWLSATAEVPADVWIAAVAAAMLAAVPFRLPSQYWRYTGISDVAAVGGAALFATVVLAGGLAATGDLRAGAHLAAAYGLSLLALLAAPRIFYRLVQGGFAPRRRADSLKTILLVGDGEGADLFLRALAVEPEPSLRVAGLLTLGARQTGRRIQGCPILGTAADAPAILDALAAEGQTPSALVLTGADLHADALAALLDAADARDVAVRRAPRPTTLQSATQRPAGAARAIELQPLVIEDLLDRAQVPLDRDGMARMVQGRRVLVTGAGGTIGSELARQVATLGPAELVLVDNGEFALWQIDLELAESRPDVPREALIADVRDAARIRAIFERIRPQLVFHAAALKHVPMVEANPMEGLLTNAVGTLNVADAARAAGAAAMVFISTDKAVNPSSLMGASKRLAEMYCQALDIAACASRAPAMRCITVRFGNVLGSTGSVVPLFRRQLARGGPLTVTHPDMQRYFMTVREAVGLVLQASVVGLAGAALPGGRDGGIFVLDMGPPVKIVDLARRMVRLAGLVPDRDVEIRFTGLRPGEKLFEELFHGREPPVPTGHPGLLMAAPRTADPAIVGRAIEEIAAACRAGQARLAVEMLGRLVPEFDHNPGGEATGAHA